MTEILEAIMVICFGLSWPASIVRSYKAGTAKGKSLFFLLMIWIGYAAGIAWKVIEFGRTNEFRYPAVFYVINIVMVSIDVVLYFRNRKLDRANETIDQK